jgi:hypothetical protein
MNTRTLFIVILIGAVLLIVYTEIKKNPPDKPVASTDPNHPRTFWESVNDLSYNILFGWWVPTAK